MRYEIVEILRRANEIEDNEKRANFLKLYMKYPLEMTLAAFHNKDVKFETFRAPKFKVGKPFDMGMADSTIELQLKKLYLLRKDHEDIPFEKKEEIFIRMLELLSKEEQDLLLAIVRKENPYKKITRPFIKKYFPHILTYNIKRP